jgi:hypothetical protein
LAEGYEAMLTFELSERFLTAQETPIFDHYLAQSELDGSIWPVFNCFFRAAVPGTTPLVLRAWEDGELCGAAIVIRCLRYGKSLFDAKGPARLVDTLRMPNYLWVKFGCCMDMMSNPGFVRDPARAPEMHAAMAGYLKRHCLSSLIYDYDDRASLYPGAAVMPTMPHALIDVSDLGSTNDYLGQHKNMRRKLNIFRNNGGTFEVVANRLAEVDVGSVKRCFLATAAQSIVYLPYQDLYLSAALLTSSTHLDNVYYFVARLNGEFLGYQAAVATGSHLNALHGAFDRERTTTHHAYDVLFVQMVDFAIAHKLKSIDFGAVLNVTKQRAVNKAIPMSYFLYSRYGVVQRFLDGMLRQTKMQGQSQLKFRSEPSE